MVHKNDNDDDFLLFKLACLAMGIGYCAHDLGVDPVHNTWPQCS